MRRAPPRTGRRAVGWGTALSLASTGWAPPARAHHVPGHGASEGARGIPTIAVGGARAQTQLTWLGEFEHDGPKRPIAAQTYRNSLLAELAPIPALGLALQVPLDVYDERGRAVQAGLGELRGFVRVTPHADKLVHRVPTFGVSVAAPTRTVRASVDPGPTWTVAGFAVFTRTYDRLYWQALALPSVEQRRAGVALELALGGQLGARLAGHKLTLGAGPTLDLRIVNACRSPGGALTHCREGRAGEFDRPDGAARLGATALIAGHVTPRWTLFAAATIPVTARRDVDVALALGVQHLFAPRPARPRPARRGPTRPSPAPGVGELGPAIGSDEPAAGPAIDGIPDAEPAAPGLGVDGPPHSPGAEPADPEPAPDG